MSVEPLELGMCNVLQREIIYLLGFIIFYYLIELQIGFYPVAVVPHYDTTHKNTHHTTAYKATQTINNTLHTMNTTQKK
jgi:hypothetical protein